MKILQVSTWDNVGGASRATYRLNQALNQSGVTSQLLCAVKTTNDPSVIGPTSWIGNKIASTKILLDNLPSKLDRQKLILNSYSWLPGNISNKINSLNPDIVHLHWVGGGFLRPESLLRIKAPIVWTLHDQWPLLGASHHLMSQSIYTDPRLNPFILNQLLYQRKQKAYSKVTINTISPSEWLHQKAIDNFIGLHGDHVRIPNCLDTHKYRPAKSHKNKKQFTLLFIAMNADRDPNKGFKLLKESLNYIKSKVTLLIVGAKTSKEERYGQNIKLRFIPTIKNEKELISYYNQADLTLLPSLIENLPYIAMESLACGTPVLAYNVGGNSDLVKNNKTGFLIEPYDHQAFGLKIEELISHDSNVNKLSQNISKFAQNNFSYQQIAKKHINFYHKILK